MSVPKRSSPLIYYWFASIGIHTFNYLQLHLPIHLAFPGCSRRLQLELVLRILEAFQSFLVPLFLLLGQRRRLDFLVVCKSEHPNPRALLCSARLCSFKLKSSSVAGSYIKDSSLSLVPKRKHAISKNTEAHEDLHLCRQTT